MIVEAFLFLYLFVWVGLCGRGNTILRGNTLFYGIRKMRAVRETRKAADGRFQIFSYLCSGFRMAAVVFFALRPSILAGSPVSGGC